MPQPPAYNRSKDFIEDYPSETDHSAINNELDAAALSINAIRTNLALIQRDDGRPQNGIVTADTIHPDFIDELSAEINAKLGVEFSEMSLGQYFKETFTAGVDFTPGSSTQITLTGTPSSKPNTQIHFDEEFVQQTEYSLAGQVVTFDAPIPLGVAQVEIGWANVLSEGLIGDGTVLTQHLADDVFSGLTQASPAGNDYVVISDTSEGGAKRKAPLGQVTSAIPANAVTANMLSDSVVSGLTPVVADVLDSVLIADASDASKKKRATVGSILQQLQPGSINTSHLASGVVAGLTAVAAEAGDSVFISDVSDSGANKRALISSILSLYAPPAASTSAPGDVQLASSIEAIAGVNPNKAVTPAALGGGTLSAANGYIWLPGQLLLQWIGHDINADVSGSGMSVNLMFPVSFPTAVFHVWGQIYGAGSNNRTLILVREAVSLSQVGFRINEISAQVQDSWGISIFAIGR